MSKFRFGDKVRIISGFYEGCEGILIDCIIETYKAGGSIESRYIFDVEIEKLNDKNYYLRKTIHIDAHLLRLIRKTELK